MKTIQTKAEGVASAQKSLDELLSEAMKQPGVKVAMDVLEATEKYSVQVASQANLLGWMRFPSFSSSCSTYLPD